MTVAARIRYPTKAAITRAVETARDLGLDVAGFEVSPDGTIRIMEARSVPAQTDSLFDKLKASGRL